MIIKKKIFFDEKMNDKLEVDSLIVLVRYLIDQSYFVYYEVFHSIHLYFVLNLQLID